MTTVTATLKIVLRDLPATQERDGLITMTLTNEPKGLPKGTTLAPVPLTLSCATKQWRTACANAEKVRAGGAPALFIVEAHIGTDSGTLIGIVKGIQVVPGKVTTAPAPEAG